MFRNATLRRAVASFFLLELAGSLAAPSLSYALMGPGQPEFTSYESAGSPDMVNLSTGDMTYNVPVLEIPGPETTFSLPLTYRAGIRPEQEASWVGLGWSMNPGSIVRNVNGYPDDASGQLAINSYNDPGVRGWQGGLPGVLQLAWDSETGHSGSASLLGFVSASWSGGKLQSGDIIGIGATRGEGFTVDGVKLAGAALTAATFGAGAGLSVGAKVALQAGGAVVAGVGIAALGKHGQSSAGFSQPTVNIKHTWFYTKYEIFSNDTTKEAMFGSLYFDKLSNSVDRSMGGTDNPNDYSPAIYDGATKYQNNQSRLGYKFQYNRQFTSQGNFSTEAGADMQTSPGAVNIAHDDFIVMGPGISGTIRPQRLDVGSLAYPRQVEKYHDKYNLVPYTSYKVPFRYENTASNTYTYSGNNNPAATPLGVDASQWNNAKLVLNDAKLHEAPGARIEGNRLGLTDKRLVQGKQIDWFTNKEIADAYDSTPATYPIAEHKADVAGTKTRQVLTGYTEVTDPDGNVTGYEPTYGPQTTTSANIFRRLAPEDGIGAFAITAEDGTTYHYSLPVYHFREHAQSTSMDGKGVGISHKGALGTDVANYATAWLLTAITSPDYVDRGTIGVVDEQDLGTWVKFSYGKFAQQFKWRQPYVGKETRYKRYRYDDGTGITYKVTMEATNESVQEGAKETYYLNSISTRTHTALFIKSVRQDGRGHYGSANNSNLGIDESTPSSSLRLDEIVVLSNRDLAAIKTSTDFGENTANNAASQNTSLGGLDSFERVLDQNDISANSAIRPALNQKALKRVVFNYSYRLCVGAPNSFASATAPPALGSSYSAANRTGRLTLESIATYGPNNVKLIPDFLFEYGFNPNYDPVKWDAFGMYARNATSSSHLTDNDFTIASQDGAAWSLAKITNPLGATTEITYERDQYSHVSEHDNSLYKLVDQGADDPTGILDGDYSVDLTKLFHAGDWIKLRGYASGTYQLHRDPLSAACGASSTYSHQLHKSFDDEFQIRTVTPNEISLWQPLPSPKQALVGEDDCFNYYIDNTIEYGVGYCQASVAIPLNRNGGDIRVAAITTRDERNQAYVVKYAYTNDMADPHNSSGVIAKEPEYMRQRFFDFEYLYDYPNTPIMYGRTTVLRGNFNTLEDIDQREEYSFHTVNSAMVQTDSKVVNSNALYAPLGKVASLKQQKNTVDVSIGLLGQAKSIRKYNRRGTLEFSTVFDYTTSLPNDQNQDNQAVYAESALLSEFRGAQGTNPTYWLNWTTKRYLPTVLHSTTTTTNNVAATTTTNRYDFYSGAVTETQLKSSLGDTYRSTTVPAYTRYPGMGPKTEAAGNKHMLTQTAATYSYKETGPTSSLLAAGIQTWNSNWTNYRRYDAGSDRYQADPQASAPIWRQHRTYLWQSPRVNPDGTYASFIPYNWNQSSQAPNWLNVGEVTLYDHYSRPLESKDVNGNYATQKAGYDESQVLAAASNARYTEIAYSGAEDQILTGPSNGHFGGEVRDGGRQSSTQKHSGQFSSLLTGDNPMGFTYKAIVGNNQELQTNRTYRASAWVFSDSEGATSTNGARLYVKLNGVTVKEIGIANGPIKRAGKWYLLNVDIDLAANATGQELLVGCRNAGGSDVYVDDFRFHPLDAPLQTTVYDPSTRQPTYVLDNDNLFTHYQYDEAGKVVKVFREVLTPSGSAAPAERLIKEVDYNYARPR